MKYKNPIISGYNPDPSICCVGDDYYIVNSSFEFFPGVPVYHSKNLVNWELINYCLTDKEQLYLEKCRPSGGIYAPTLRYHDGEFFMTTTNVTDKGNFIVHTKDIRGKWSAPVWIDQGDIDPTILWDDGKVYFASTGMDEEGKQGIYLCEINPYTGEKFTDSVCISYGSGGKYPEGPHLYKWFGKYYLLLAEGGTEYGHMVTVFRSDSVWGPYEACPHNPILTHRNNMSADISCTGHSDIMEDHNGNWWIACLATRPSGPKDAPLMLHHLGRETFLAPVIWDENGWPVVGNNGTIELEMEGPLPGTEGLTNAERERFLPVCQDFSDDFSEKEFGLPYNFLRNPHSENYVRDTEAKELILKGTNITINEIDSPTWVGVRQKSFEMEAEVTVSLKCDTETVQKNAVSDMTADLTEQKNNQIRAGLTAFYNDSYHYEIYVTKEVQGKAKVCLAKHVHDIFAVTASAEIDSVEEVMLKITSDREYYHFYYKANGEYVLLGSGLTIGLATEATKTMTFTGTYIGLFAENVEAGFRNFRVKIGEE